MKRIAFICIAIFGCLFQTTFLAAKSKSVPKQESLPLYLYVGQCYKVGMFAEFSFIVGLLDEYDRNPEKYNGIEVDFKTTGLYYDPLYGPNWWSYFCEPIRLGSRSGAVIREFKALDYRFDFKYALDVLTTFPKERVRQIIDKYIHLKKPLTDKVEDFVQNNFVANYVIGIHYRGTDKKKEVPRVPYEMMLENVKNVIDSYGSDDYIIFVASDEEPFIQYMKESFSGAVVATDIMRSDNEQPLHEKRLLNKYESGESALLDCLLLSRTDILIHTDSNLSTWATYFNPQLEELIVRKNVQPRKIASQGQTLHKKKNKKRN